MDAVTHVPAPLNEPVLTYAPGLARARRARGAGSPELAAEPLELTMTIGGRQRMAGGEQFDVVQPHQHAAVLGSRRTPRTATREDAVARARRPPRRAGGSCPSTTGPRSSCRPPTCWPARGGRRSTPPPCSASPRPPTRPRSTRPAS